MARLELLPGLAVLNIGYMVAGVQLMHTRLMRGEKLRYYRQDIALPLAAVLFIVLPARWLFPGQSSAVLTVVLLLTLLVLTWTVGACLFTQGVAKVELVEDRLTTSRGSAVSSIKQAEPGDYKTC
jgi:hypothetical protein